MLPPGYDSKKFITQAVQAIALSAPLQKCSAGSLVVAVLQAAEIGLDLSPSLGQCCLVPYADEAHFQIMAKGYITLIVGGGGARSITPHCVYEGDHFVYDVANQTVQHTSCGESDPKKLKAVYSRIVLPSGEIIFDVLTKEKVFRARNSSRAYQYAIKNKKSSIWTGEHEDEMWMKTAVRHGAKLCPLKSNDISVRLSKALEVDNSEFDLDAPAAPKFTAPRKKSDPAPVVDAESTDVPVGENDAADFPDTRPAMPLMVVGGDKEEGVTKGKKWTRYTVTLNDGRILSTFSSTIFAEAKRAKTGNKAVTITTETKGEFENLKTLEVIE